MTLKRLIVICSLVAMLVAPLSAAAQTSSRTATQEALIQAMLQLIAILQEQVRILQAQLAAKLQSTQTPATIDANAVVYLSCRYQSNYNPQNTAVLASGTGVIVNPKGYILTARHIIDPAWTVQSYSTDPNISFYNDLAQDFTLKECTVSYPSANRLPTPEEIRTLNPTIFVGEEKYTATIHFLPARDNMSTQEYNRLDFAILRIERGVSCAAVGCGLPQAFPYAALNLASLPGTPELVSYGYPSEVGASLRGGLRGATGNLVKYYAGDSRFVQKPLLFEWSATDSRKGRSGSPVFQGARVMGILLGAEAENVTISYGLALPAINDVLFRSGLGEVLAP